MVPKVQTALKAVGDAEWAGATVPLQRALSTFMSVREVSVDSLSVPDVCEQTALTLNTGPACYGPFPKE
jgi:hypothetical protein